VASHQVEASSRFGFGTALISTAAHSSHLWQSKRTDDQCLAWFGQESLFSLSHHSSSAATDSLFLASLRL
jgi:hypothetical protein